MAIVEVGSFSLTPSSKSVSDRVFVNPSTVVMSKRKRDAGTFMAPNRPTNNLQCCEELAPQGTWIPSLINCRSTWEKVAYIASSLEVSSNAKVHTPIQCLEKSTPSRKPRTPPTKDSNKGTFPAAEGHARVAPGFLSNLEKAHRHTPSFPVQEVQPQLQHSAPSSGATRFNPYLFMKLLPSYDGVRKKCDSVLPAKPKAAPQKSLVLDLDETLVHCSVERVDHADLRFPVQFNGIVYEINACKRPHMEEFLAKVSQQYEVIVFTASQEVYARRLLDLIDPDRKYVHHRLYRDSCLQVQGNYLKDLNVLGRDLSQVLLVDNSPHAFGYQVDNGVPIMSWFDDANDTELLKLLPFLESLVDANDVRVPIRSQFRTQEIIDSMTCV